jgi:SecD/SecF fusion protein
LCELADQSTDLTVKKIVDESGMLRARWISAGRPIDLEHAGEAENWGRLHMQELASAQIRTCEDGSVEVLVKEDAFQVGGNHIASVRPSLDSQLRPCLDFRMTARGAVLFGALTGANLPDRTTDRYAQLGIIVDGELLSAPRINDRVTERGQIPGNFTADEVEFLAAVLRAGALPMNLGPVPWSLTRVPGGQVARWAVWGVLATVASLLLVSGWSVIRHGGRGLAASAAAWLMVPLLLAGLMMIHVPVTFPAVATACGLVLSSAIALVTVCGRVTIPPNTATYADGTGPPIFLSRAWPVLVIFSVLFMTGAAAYAVGIGAARGVGVVLAMGAASGVASTLLCCWPLWSMPAKVLTAIVVEFDDVQ